MGGRSAGRIRALPAVAAGVLAGVVVALLAPGTALAHNSLVSSSPNNGATVARPPSAVRLTFLARLDPTTTKVTVTGPDGASVAAAAPAFSGKNVTVRLRTGVAGQYTVAYQVASNDGHPIKGAVRFTATAGNAPEPTPSPTPTPTASNVVTPSATAPSLASAATVGDSGGGAVWWWLGGLVLAVVVGLAGVAFWRRRAVT